MPAILKVQNLNKIYSNGSLNFQALKNISFTIEKSSINSLMGKSGSGKSTLLHILGLLDNFNTGEILFENQNYRDLTMEQKRFLRLSKLGYIFQEYALIPELTALENVATPGLAIDFNQSKVYAKARELLDLVGLLEVANHLPQELSGGEKQRVAIARSLINNPVLLFADEPTANLDTLSTKIVMDLLTKINKDLGTTILFVSHDVDHKVYADNLLFLKDGRMVEPYL